MPPFLTQEVIEPFSSIDEDLRLSQAVIEVERDYLGNFLRNSQDIIEPGRHYWGEDLRLSQIIIEIFRSIPSQLETDSEGIIAFPWQLPQSTQGGFGAGPEATSRRNAWEVGLPRQRRIYRGANRLFSCRWDFSETNYRIFDEWFKKTCDYGRRDFDIFLDGWWYTANFIETPAFTVEVDVTIARWLVAAKLFAKAGTKREEREHIFKLRGPLKGAFKTTDPTQPFRRVATPILTFEGAWKVDPIVGTLNESYLGLEDGVFFILLEDDSYILFE